MNCPFWSGLGQLITGEGVAHLAELLFCMDMSKQTFKANEELFGKEWIDILEEELLAEKNAI